MDIDIDTQGSKREEIIAMVKEKYGENNVLNIGTFTQEKTKSAIATSCRGLSISDFDASSIVRTVPVEKGNELWSIKDALYGNLKTGKSPAKKFIGEIRNYDGLRESLEIIENLISGSGCHASGVVIFPNGITSQNAYMKTKGENGNQKIPITQFDAEDTEYMGGLKLDFLSISALDRIRTAMDFMLEKGAIEWKGTLKETYEYYFSYENLDLKSKDIYELLYNGELINAFQFEGTTGIQALEKIKPATFDEVCSANSLMRLTNEGEQALDTYVKHKKDIGLWYSEMNEFGLTKKEIEIMEKHLLSTYGICDTQEVLMKLSLDPDISNFDLTEANFLRKAVAKKNPKKIEEQRQIFFDKGKESGTSETLLNYVWDVQMARTFG